MIQTDPFAHRSHIADGRIIDIGRASIWVHDDGGNGEPVLLLGGFTAGHFIFDLARPFLADYRLLTLEPCGLGPSIAHSGGLNAESWADDAAAVLEHLGIDRVLVWATGFGSYTAYALAARHPQQIRALAAYTDIWAGDDTKAYAKIWSVYRAIVENFGTKGFGARVLANVFDVSGVSWFGDWEARNIESVLNPATVDKTVGYGCLHADVRYLLDRIDCPVAIIQGTQSWDGGEIEEADDPSLSLLRRKLPTLRVVRIPGAHPAYVLVQKPEECARAVHEFFSSLGQETNQFFEASKFKND